MAPSTSPMTWSSGTPPKPRARAATSSGLAGAGAGVEVRADGGEAVVGELAHDLQRPLVPAGHVVDDDDAGKRPVALRPR